MKLARLCKRRAIAQEMIEIGAVRLDQKTCKPSSNVQAGSILEIAYAAHILKIEVTCADEDIFKRTRTGHYNVIQKIDTASDVRPW